ncbi:MAG: ATP-dependent DNA helicase RecG [Parcubacteria group bacterium]|nr:ATP-dependent DNA helicase RecG [Parcubacteria group bacterium]
MISPSAPLEKVPRIGSLFASKLKRLGLRTVEDLLFYFPRTYHDLTHPVTIAEAMTKEEAVMVGTVEKITFIRSRVKRLAITQATIRDDSGEIRAVWFGNRFVAKTLKKGVPYLFYGRLGVEHNNPFLVGPQFERINNRGNLPVLLAVYPETKGVTSKLIRYALRMVMSHSFAIRDPLPVAIETHEHFPSLVETLRMLHVPKNQEEITRAQTRVAFAELLNLQLKHLLARRERMDLSAPPIPLAIQKLKDFVSRLPFQLTNDQRKALWKIVNECGKGFPMQRLLSGDVGSGKTAVAAGAILNAAAGGFSSLFMVPTEVLALQHFATLTKLFSHDSIVIGLATQAYWRVATSGKIRNLSRASFLKKLERGEIMTTIGTHTLIASIGRPPRLGLVVVDEQHRFGVSQRASLARGSMQHETVVPHYLSLTATPIPRTLALAIYGDLDVTQLKELPRGRIPVTTRVILTPEDRKDLYEHVRREASLKHAIFVLCPHIDEKDTLGVRAVTSEYKRLSKEVFLNLKVGMLHGRLGSDEKERSLKALFKKRLDVLVTTSVIEVGVDIPHATIMIIENAERFGLAQLHQLRGRVGRSDIPSFCYVIPSQEAGMESRVRLGKFAELTDGFALAELDLKLRGPGDALGNVQSGFPDLKMASLFDLPLIEKARAWAGWIIQSQTKLPQARELVASTTASLHLE